MITIEGLYNNAICYTSQIEDSASEQIKKLCDQKSFEDCKIRIMPDVHAGMACTIGTTMTITDKIVPNIVGVDIGCGMETVRIYEDSIDFERLDKIIHMYVPSGFSIHTKAHKLSTSIELEKLKCAKYVNLDRAYKSIGTLGGGNHFIELAKSPTGELYIVVHSGSRHLGCEVAQYYQKTAYDNLCGKSKNNTNDLIKKLKAENLEKNIQLEIKNLNTDSLIDIPEDLAYVEGYLFDDYLHDMKIVQDFAVLNRKAIMNTILVGMRLKVEDEFTTTHNYIDTNDTILRKGAVSAKKGKTLLIPINMRDGSLICVGKGNVDWNFSAPHGAGRLMSRSMASSELSMEKYIAEMKGIYSSCINKDTLDESPMAYRPMEDIIENIRPTVDIVNIIIPLYNLKQLKSKEVGDDMKKYIPYKKQSKSK